VETIFGKKGYVTMTKKRKLKRGTWENKKEKEKEKQCPNVINDFFVMSALA
jgi:hypothetical protein